MCRLNWGEQLKTFVKIALPLIQILIEITTSELEISLLPKKKHTCNDFKYIKITIEKLLPKTTAVGEPRSSVLPPGLRTKTGLGDDVWSAKKISLRYCLLSSSSSSSSKVSMKVSSFFKSHHLARMEVRWEEARVRKKGMDPPLAIHIATSSSSLRIFPLFSYIHLYRFLSRSSETGKITKTIDTQSTGLCNGFACSFPPSSHSLAPPQSQISGEVAG